MDPNPIYPFEKKYFVGRSWMVLDGVLAERVGFEPTVPVKVQRFSRPYQIILACSEIF